MISTRIDRPGGVVECSLVPWDTEVFGFPVAQIDRIDLADGAGPSAQATGAADLLDAFDGWCDERDVRLVSCRLDHFKLRESMALEERGFRFIETVYGPRFDAFERIDAPRHALLVTEATPDDLARLAEIAAAAFTTGRFLLDARLPPDLSDRRYATWVRNAFEGPNQQVLKATATATGATAATTAAGSGEDIVGFFIVERRADASVYWHLTAIAPEWQGKGIGLSLWQTMLARHRQEGARFVETTISAHNLPALNLYGRLGFSFASAQMTLHWLREPAA